MSVPQAKVQYLQTAATTNGNGTPIDVSGFDACIQVEVVETAGGTCTLVLAGSLDGTNWYTVGYQRVDAVTAPTRSVASISVTANLKAVYQILDPYPLYRAVVSSSSSQTVNVRAYSVA